MSTGIGGIKLCGGNKEDMGAINGALSTAWSNALPPGECFRLAPGGLVRLRVRGSVIPNGPGSPA